MTRLIGFAGKRNNFRNETFERRCGATPRKKYPQKMKNVRFPNKNVPILCHCEERSDAAILKFEVWHPAAKHGSTKQEGSPITKKGDSLRRFAASLFIYGSVSFRATIVRSGMANRSVKDCRVGRKKCALLAMTSLVGFAGKRNNFRNETIENGTISGTKRLKADAERCHIGASSEAPCHAGAGSHFLCEAFFTRSRNHVTLLLEVPAFRGSPKNNGRHECVRHYSLCDYRKQPTAAITLLPRAWACRGAYTWFS